MRELKLIAGAVLFVLSAAALAQDAGGCTEAAAKIGARLKAAGYADSDLHYFVAPEHPREGGLVAVLPGSDAHVKALLLLAHLDVAEAGAAWVDTMIRLRQTGDRPKRSVKMALTCGEQSGAEFDGARHLIEHEPKLLEAAFALYEFTRGVLDAGRRVSMEVQVGEKRSQDYRLEVTNPGGHSSRPVKKNAIYTLAAGLTRISEHDFPVQFNAITRGYFTRMAPIVGGKQGAAMKSLLQHSDDETSAAILSEDPRLNALLRTTCVVTLWDAGHATNALPQRARANINCRLFPDDQIEAVRETLARVVADGDIRVSALQPAPLMKMPPLSDTVMQPIEAVTKRFYPGIPVVPVLQAADTDAIYTTAAGIPTYGLGGIFIDPDLGNVHGANERIRVESLDEDRDFLFALVKVYAQQTR